MHVVPPAKEQKLLFDVSQSLQEQPFERVDKLYESTFNTRFSLFKPQPILVAEEDLLSLEKSFDGVDKLYEPVFNPALSLFKPKSILAAEEELLTWKNSSLMIINAF